MTTLFKKIIQKVELHHNVTRTRNELYRLSDHELSDIGITRYDIERIARGA